ncbi:MAG: hypothetical protein V8S57_07350 [Oscillospiraceae bacterium]
MSPDVASAAALCGHIADPRGVGQCAGVELPERFQIDDSGAPPPAHEAEAAGVEILRGPNIRPLPLSEPLHEEIAAPLMLKVGDNITTHHLPRGRIPPPPRSNPKLSEFCFTVCDETFPARAQGRPVTASSSATRTTARAPRASTRRWCPCTSVCAR